MRHFKSLRTIMAVAVFCIMCLSGLLTFGAVLLLNRFELVSLLQSRLGMPILVLGVSLIIGTILSFFISNTVLKPVNELIAAMNRITEGDFSVRVKPRGTGSLVDRIIGSFNTMAEDLAGTEIFRRDFIDVFSHEFKTPIVSIRGFAKQLQNEDLDPELSREYIDIIISESERMSNMSGNILLLTKLENQQIVGDKEIFDLDEQLRDSILLLENHWEKKNTDWQLELDDIQFYGNEELLKQLWINLLGNAVKYSPDNAAIEVSCRKTEGKVKVRISDHGEGIAPDKLKFIFDKFYQADSSHSAEGNGLGLAIVRRIVELHGGHIRVESEQGRGSSFFIELPIEMN